MREFGREVMPSDLEQGSRHLSYCVGFDWPRAVPTWTRHRQLEIGIGFLAAEKVRLLIILIRLSLRYESRAHLLDQAEQVVIEALGTLTARELEVLRGVAQGNSNGGIAEARTERRAPVTHEPTKPHDFSGDTE